jgi:predicted transporter
MVLNKLSRNKKGQQIFIGIMTAVLVFIALTQMITPLKVFIDGARTGLGCGGAGLSTGTAAACVIVDWYMPYFLAAGIAVAVGFITQRKYVQIQQ